MNQPPDLTQAQQSAMTTLLMGLHQSAVQQETLMKEQSKLLKSINGKLTFFTALAVIILILQFISWLLG